IDRQRVLAHGMGVGGQMAFYLGFHARDSIRGVAATGAVLASQPKENLAIQLLSFLLVVGGNGPLGNSLAGSGATLLRHLLSVIEVRLDDAALERLYRYKFTPVQLRALGKLAHETGQELGARQAARASEAFQRALRSYRDALSQGAEDERISALQQKVDDLR